MTNRSTAGDNIYHPIHRITPIQRRLTPFEDLNPFDLGKRQIADIKIATDAGGIIDRNTVNRDQGVGHVSTPEVNALILSHITIRSGNGNTGLLTQYLCEILDC